MRTKFNPQAGPDGGDGGRGGHIILRGNKNMWTLLHLRYYKNVLAENGRYAALVQLLAQLTSVTMLAFLPLALAFSIFRYRLWDIDVLLNRALVYGLLTASVLGLYGVLVVVAGVFLQNPANPIPAAIAIGVLAMLFQPLHRRLQIAVPMPPIPPVT